MKFEELALNDNVLDALSDMHFDTCTPVQEKCIPQILSKRDVMGVAQTGTGKTAAYLLPILSMLDSGNYPEETINCLIMAPTRELAQQIDQAMQGFGYYLNGISSVAIYGGNDGNRYDQELKSLKLGADVVIATPGRFISHISMGNVDLSKVNFFVLDEADRMLDMGFSEDIMTIAKKLPKTCQTIMFSATMPDKINQLARTLLKNPIEIKLAVSKPAEKIKQMAYICYETQKLGIIKDIFKKGDLKRVIIFCGAKQKVKQVSQALQRMKINCDEMHSDLEQAERNNVMFKFKSGQTDVLVATDILSRGIDIDDIAMVINYDVPRDAEDYVHRIGRTARADRNGSAITLVGKEDINYFKQIEKFIGKEVEKMALPETEGEAPEYKAEGKPQRARSNKRTPRNNKRKPQATDQQPTAEQRNNKTTPSAPAPDTGATATNQDRPKRKPNRKKKPANAQTIESNTAQQNKQKSENKQQDNKQPRKQRNDRRNNRQQTADNDTRQPRQTNEQRINNNRKRPNNRRRNSERTPNSDLTKTTTPTTKTNESKGLKAIIEKPLRWLKWLKK